MRRGIVPMVLLVALVMSACGGAQGSSTADTSRATEQEEEALEVSQGPFGAGSGIQRDDDCVQITRGESAEIVALDNVFAPECPVLVSDQVFRVRNLGIRDHSFTISENPDDTQPFLLDLDDIEGGDVAETDGPLSDFLEPGTYEFFCKYHSGMDGVLELLESLS